MKSSALKTLASAGAFFAFCASAVACNDQCPTTYPSYPAQPVADTGAPTDGVAPIAPLNPVAPISTAELRARAAALKTAAARAASQRAAAATFAATKNTQARITVVTSPSTTSTIPSARVQVVPADSSDTKPAGVGHLTAVTPAQNATVAVVTPGKEDTKEDDFAATTKNGDVAKSLESLSSTTDEASKIADSIKGLVGDWMAVSRQGDGELSTVELQLDDHGWAKLTVPGPDGKSSTTTHKVELKDSQLTLTGGSSDVTLGKLVSADSRQMVLERDSGLVTFVRP